MIVDKMIQLYIASVLISIFFPLYSTQAGLNLKVMQFNFDWLGHTRNKIKNMLSRLSCFKLRGVSKIKVLYLLLLIYTLQTICRATMYAVSTNLIIIRYQCITFL